MIEPLEILDCEQGAPEWYQARLGIVTASCFADVMAKGEGKTRGKYLRTLAGEILTGECAESYSNAHMERGKVMEDDARTLYAFKFDVLPTRVGFMRRGRKGASPDSLVGDAGMLEIKTKLAHLQLEVLEKDRLPPEHVAQVQGQLWISGREWCDFVSYWPRLPLFCKRVYRDDAYIEKLAGFVDTFLAELDALVAKYQTQERIAA